jgi:hypothetical protein
MIVHTYDFMCCSVVLHSYFDAGKYSYYLTFHVSIRGRVLSSSYFHL